MQTNKKTIMVAVDGTVGSGKSTVCRAIAKNLRLCYIDSGAMYRATGLYCIRNGIDLNDKEAVVACLDQIKLDFINNTQGQWISLNGEDVTEKIRTQQIAQAASKVGSIDAVRVKLVAIQQNLAAGRDSIMDGRDIGTVVLPSADVKIYMTASVNERTMRRCNELREKGLPHDFDTVKSEIKHRDYQDMNRTHSPLRKAEDALLLDTTGMSFDAVVLAAIAIIAQKL